MLLLFSGEAVVKVWGFGVLAVIIFSAIVWKVARRSKS